MVYEGSSKLGDFFKSRKEKGTSGLPTFSVTLTNGLVPRDSLDRKMETNIGDEEHLLARKGDIAYNMMRMWQGASGLAKADGLLSPAYVVLMPKKGIDSLYASYLFKSPRLIYLFWAYSYGLTNDRLRLYYNDFKNIPLTVPSVQEQQKIAQILSTWDKAIERLEALIAAKQKRKKALMQQLLTGKQRFAGFEGEWKEIAIRQMGKIVSGGTPDTNIDEYWDGDILWMTPTDVTSLKNRFISDTARKITNKGQKNSSATIIPAGSLLVCTRATIGIMSISTTDITTNQGFKNLVPNKNFDVDFLYYLFTHSKDKFIRYACGSTFFELSKKDFEKLTFKCPELQEQQKIASVLSAADTEIETRQKQLAALKEQKKGLMQQLLTGKKRVKL